MPDRMLGATSPSFCPICRTTAGPACPDRGASSRRVKRRERQQLRRLINTEMTDYTKEDT